ncbi:GroES-like protein [Zopfochytrium polystomum]|nr:GroES-like protein [Zopfochytrium polystomum]
MKFMCFLGSATRTQAFWSKQILIIFIKQSLLDCSAAARPATLNQTTLSRTSFIPTAATLRYHRLLQAAIAMSSTSRVHRALVVAGEDKSLAVREVPVPVPQDGEVLIKTCAAAQNPTDWKHVAFRMAGPGKVVGCDIAGVVEELGPGAEKLLPGIKVGDRVAAWEHGGLRDGEGGYSEHLRVAADLVIRIPDSLSFEAASTIPLAAHTAAMGLRALGLPYLPADIASAVPSGADARPSSSAAAVLVWAASTSTGQYAVQLAKLAGLKVLATAGIRNHEWVRKLGADAVVDYRAENVAGEIHAAAKALGVTDLAHAYDGISEGGSILAIQECFFSSSSPSAPKGTIVCLLPQKDKTRPEVAIKNVLAYTVFGRSFSWPNAHFPASAEDRRHGPILCRGLELLLRDGRFTPNPVKLIPGGLAGVPEGFAYMQSGKVAGEKLVYVI